MLHNFKNGDKVYLMNGRMLMSGIITDQRHSDPYKFDKFPIEKMEYLPVRWDGMKGWGSPHFSSLSLTKEPLIQKWYEEELERLNKTHKRLLNSKK